MQYSSLLMTMSDSWLIFSAGPLLWVREFPGILALPIYINVLLVKGLYIMQQRALDMGITNQNGALLKAALLYFSVIKLLSHR